MKATPWLVRYPVGQVFRAFPSKAKANAAIKFLGQKWWRLYVCWDGKVGTISTKKRKKRS